MELIEKNVMPRAFKGHTLISLLTALFLGIFIVIYTSMPMRWIVGFTSILIMFFLGIALRNPKQFFLALFALALPVNVINFISVKSSTHLGGPAGFYNTFLDFPLLMLYILWFPEIFISKTSKIRFSKLDFCMFGIIIFSFLSMYNAVDIKLCLYSIVQIIKMYLIFLYFGNAIKTKRELKLIINFILIGFVLECILGILQYTYGDTFNLVLLGGRQEMQTFASISRVSGTLGHPNNLARYLTFVMTIFFSLLFIPLLKIKYKIIYVAAILIGLTALILTLSRSGWISFIFSVFMLFFLGFKVKLLSLKRILTMMILFLIIISVIFIIFKDLIFIRLFTDDYGAAWSRIPSIKVALNIIKAHPFFGIGINNYTEVMHLYDDTLERITSLVTWGVHNSYLLIASEIGIIGLCFFILFIILLFKEGMKAICTADKFITYVILGVLAGISAFLASIMIDPIDLVRINFVFFWMLAGLIVASNSLEKVHYVNKKIA